MSLADNKCIPCRGGVPPLSSEVAQSLLQQLDEGWDLNSAGHLERVYLFGNFNDAMTLANVVAVIADEEKSMISQGLKISKWGKNVYVKVPIANSKGKFMGKVIRELNNKNIKLNITAVYSAKQTKQILYNLIKIKKHEHLSKHIIYCDLTISLLNWHKTDILRFRRQTRLKM
mgnify:CR=1 FL=1